MVEIFDDPRWNLYGLLREAYLAVTTAIESDTDVPSLKLDMQDLLLRLARTPGHRLRPTEISRATGSTPSSTTRLLDEAEGLNYIERVADPADRRVLLAQLTETGEVRIRHWAQRALTATTRHVNEKLSPEDALNLEDALRHLRDGAHSHLDNVPIVRMEE